MGWFLVGAAYLTTAMYVDAAMWYPAGDEDETTGDGFWERGETLLFEQPARIDAGVAAVADSVAGAPEMYFLGFAGYGEGRVFAEEIKLAAQVVGQRFATVARELLLVNDRRDLDSLPLATTASLGYALRGLANRMDVEEDILFLALSSHGSEGTLAVLNGPLMLQELSDEALAEALGASGIRWRVIVISACHAGSFVDALKNPDTIIITAAAADRTSFGCSDERDLTYFGEAFYRDALPGAETLRAAFEIADEAISRREAAEAKRASDPQAYFGEALERHLDENFGAPDPE